jgi:hypothetical protein
MALPAMTLLVRALRRSPPWHRRNEANRRATRGFCGVGTQGIFKPAQLALPLAVTTTPLSPRKPRPYDDALQADGFLRYCYPAPTPDTATTAACAS